jgi:hypothetical protein
VITVLRIIHAKARLQIHPPGGCCRVQMQLANNLREDKFSSRSLNFRLAMGCHGVITRMSPTGYHPLVLTRRFISGILCATN